jgi:hypothetical protein
MASLQELLADTQTEMIAVCAEYANGAASDIFVYASVEDRTLFFDPFFVVRGKVVTRGELPETDTSIPRQRAMVKYGSEQLRRLYDAGEDSGFAIPTQLKLHYSVQSGSLDAEFEYEPQYSHDESLDSSVLSGSWQNEVQALLDKEQQ